ncbi:hypothetical protein AGDE_08530 [Angomonas deanei]|nr:hypothetical protein AGDE_08530 [Angomonas deanei]|eukprot:EPY32603.1 hypothetical protein AGDE_08530 [Angomonas deanei]
MFTRSGMRLVWLGGVASTPSLGLELRPSAGHYVNVIPEGNQPRRVVNYADNNNNFDTTCNLRNLTEFAKPEVRQMAGTVADRKWSSKWNKVFDAGVYDELLKLPLRYKLHPFDVLHQHYNSHLTPNEGDTAQLPPGVYEMPATAKEGESDGEPYYYAVAGKVSSVGYAPPLGPADPLDVLPFFVHRDSNGRLPGKIYSMNTKLLMPNFFMRIQNIEGNLFRFEEELMKIFPTKKIFVKAHCIYIYNVGLDGRDVLHHWLYGLGFKKFSELH